MTDRRGERYGNYQLKSLLGDGNFGQVYSGEEVHDHTPVAVKILNISLTGEKELNEFLNEARMITLTHAHIVKLLDFGIQNGAPYLVMAYAPNGTLRDRHPEGTVLPLPTIISYVKPIAAALQYAHDRRLIHRDVKPENMLIGPHNEIWLSDFGIATTAHSTRSQVIQDKIGTVPYMAPEQIQGKPQPASDQYALGCVVYEWLCGTPPFSGDDMAIALQHLTTPVPPLQTRIPNISQNVEQVVLQALAKDPQQRFASVQEFANALEQSNQGKPTYFPQPEISIPPTIKVPTQVQIASNVQLSPSQPSSPMKASPPLMIGKPMPEQIYQAMVATANPYAPWGKLILNDDMKRIWGRSKDWGIEYQGELFQIKNIADKPTTHFYQNWLKPVDVRDFAYQVQVSITSGHGCAGLLFRANAKAKTYYAFGPWHGIDYSNYKEVLNLRAWVCFGNKDIAPIDGTDQIVSISDRSASLSSYFGDCNTFPMPESQLKTRRTYLLSVVAQEGTIDFYVDLQLVKRMSSIALTHGTVGLFTQRQGTSGDTTGVFGHAMLWVK